jgi:hypothetical protein
MILGTIYMIAYCQCVATSYFKNNLLKYFKYINI